MAEIPTCNLTVNGKQYYTDGFGKLGDMAKIALNMYSGAGTSCCLLLFTIISMSSGGTLVYIITFCCFLSVLMSVYNHFKYTSDLNKALAKGRPCKDDKGSIIR
jgi:hypothetical protein